MSTLPILTRVDPSEHIWLINTLRYIEESGRLGTLRSDLRSVINILQRQSDDAQAMLTASREDRLAHVTRWAVWLCDAYGLRLDELITKEAERQERLP